MNQTGIGLTKIEWPTLGLCAINYLAFGLATWFFDSLPWYVLLAAGGYIVCLHGSLQHEALHGHPTGSDLVNEALIFPALGLWMPYRRYKTLHIAHHHDEILTDPTEDPESYYWTAAQWAAIPALLRPLLKLNNTLLGRLSIGPAIAAIWFWISESFRIGAGERRVIHDWALHVLGVAAVIYWVVGICGIPVWQYLLLFAWPGLSLTLLRSFAEHRAHENTGARTILIESGAAMSLLYLNNNLHAAHHDAPALPWFGLPAYYRANKERLLQRNQGYSIKGYAAMLRQYLFQMKETTVHPFADK